MAFQTETERSSTFFPDLTLGYKLTCGGTFSAHRLAALASDGDIEQATANSTTVIGAFHSAWKGKLTGVAGDLATLGIGRQTCVADIAPLTPGQPLKAAGGGRITRFVDSALSGTLIEDNVGAAFTNQPDNDGVEVVSSDAGDTTQTVTAYYTRTGQGDTVYNETKTLNGTTQVALTDTDIARVLAVEKSAATTGTITFREASGNQTITTLAAGTLSAGKIAVTAAQVYAYNVAPTAVVDGASTKTLGLIGTDSTGTALLDSQELTGQSPVTFNSAFRTVTFLLTGDLESARTASVKVGAEDNTNRYVGYVLEASTAIDTLVDAFVMPVLLSRPAASLTRTAQEYQLAADPKIGATAGWSISATTNVGDLATLPASQTGSTLVVRVQGLKVGVTVTGFKVVAQIESAGNTVTLDAELRKLTNAAADPTDASIGSITQVSVTADTAVESEKGGLTEVVASNETLYMLITGTTGASTDIRLQGISLFVTEV